MFMTHSFQFRQNFKQISKLISAVLWLQKHCRIGKVGNQKRVVGVLLGSWQKKVLDVSNSFAGELSG